MNVQALQLTLTAAGYVCAADGGLGPETFGALLCYASQRQLGPLGHALGAGIATAFPQYSITSDLQIVHWIAQATHETEEFRYLTELGDAAYFAQYEGRADLGNTQPGDGFTYRGRGIFQITGRWNYAHFGAEIGEPLETNPDLAAQPDIAVKIACQFWKERQIGVPADADWLVGVTRKINGGLNGLADRQAILTRVRGVCGV